ncbi:MAG: hypothetical protein C0404_14760 [Verrucomicrobia bacterium]|nr:hypothetical protein [Verrucomicrobiota bacterium]
MHCRLVQLAPEEDQAILLYDDVNTIGRDPKNTIQLLFDSLSRFHAQIIKGDAHCEVKDLTSSNGTHVNGERVNSRTLHHGDEISFGDLVFRYEEGEVSKQGRDFIPKKFSHKSIYATVRVKPSRGAHGKRAVRVPASSPGGTAQRLLKSFFG